MPPAYAEADHSPTPRGPETVVCLRSGNSQGRQAARRKQGQGQGQHQRDTHGSAHADVHAAAFGRRTIVTSGGMPYHRQTMKSKELGTRSAKRMILRGPTESVEIVPREQWCGTSIHGLSP